MSMARMLVLLIFPPNAEGPDAFGNEDGVAPHIGILALASALAEIEGVEPVYIDGDVHPLEKICELITLCRNDILAVCVGPWTSGYASALRILEHTRGENPRIATILGSAHLTALPELCMQNQRAIIDYGLVGYEIVGSLRQVVADLARGGPVRPCPGLLYHEGDQVVSVPQSPEPLFTRLDYRLVDGLLPHSDRYEANFRENIAPYAKQLFGREPRGYGFVEVARGCIKFKHDDACSFCCLSRGGMWKNQVGTGPEAWEVVHDAYEAGIDYMFFVTDELPLTFRALLVSMKQSMPAWYLDLPQEERPIFEGYARADGLVIPSNAELLFELGFRNMFIGVDAGPMTSLRATNKQLNVVGRTDSLERLYDANHRAFKSAKQAGLLVEIGYVLGHLGATPELIEQSVTLWNELVGDNRGTIAGASVEVLKPLPGSLDYRCMLDPKLAAERAKSLGLPIADERTRTEIAERWQGCDEIDGPGIQADYRESLMPALTTEQIQATLSQMVKIANRYEVGVAAM
jgi:anaerobic magnesium-protoporphyrin IX monomethyl ester cyclase